MRTVRIYQPGHYQPGQTLTLSDAASQHVGVVLRMEPGQHLTLFCGDNRAFPATILSVHKRQVTVQIDDVFSASRESPRLIHLAQAISKGERMEWVIQKAVELGVGSITPLITEHCVVRLDAERMSKKLSQWQAIVVAACEQSGRNKLPVVHPVSTLERYVKQCDANLKWVLHPKTQNTWRDFQPPKGDIALLIGPEGGLSEHEIHVSMQHQFHPLTLGPRVLRTETAAIAAMSILQAIWGDL